MRELLQSGCILGKRAFRVFVEGHQSVSSRVAGRSAPPAGPVAGEAVPKSVWGQVRLGALAPSKARGCARPVSVAETADLAHGFGLARQVVGCAYPGWRREARLNPGCGEIAALWLSGKHACHEM